MIGERFSKMIKGYTPSGCSPEKNGKRRSVASLTYLKKPISIFILLLLLSPLFLLVSCTEDHTYAEFTLSAPRDYDEYDATGEYDLAFTDGYATVGLTRISLVTAEQTGLDISYSPGDFAAFFMEKAGIDSKLQTEDGIPYYTYFQNVYGKKYYYLAAFYRTEGAYFTVTCMVEESLAVAYIDEFKEIITSAKMQKGKN